MAGRGLPWVLVLAVLAGCGRGFYRRQADRDSYSLVGTVAAQTEAGLPGCSIDPGPESRMFNPGLPDFPPMPPDDPQSHQLMQCVDGKRGSRRWGRYGCTDRVESPSWEEYLPRNEDGQLAVDRRTAVQLALVHSRDYQSQLENLYLSALDVSFERFVFDTQFFGGNSTFFTADGPARGGSSSSLLTIDNDLEARKLFATGAELVVGMANSLIWQFSGPNDYSAFTLLDFSVLQPLLRAGGRAVVLEALTGAERALLANVRQMERFRRGFYAHVVTGRSPGSGPSRGGIGLAAPGGGGGGGGLIGLLETQVRIRNQEFNVAGLRESLSEVEAAEDAGRIDRLQVDQARQALYNAQSSLLRLENGYQDSLDAYKVQIGLPPALDMVIDDLMLERFRLIDPAIEATEERIHESALAVRSQPDVASPENLAELRAIREAVLVRLGDVVGERLRLDAELPQRRESLGRLLARQGERGEPQVDPSVLSVDALDGRIADFDREYGRTSRFMGVTLLLVDHYQKTVAEQLSEGGTPQSWRLLAKLRTLADLMDKLTGVGIGQTSDVYIAGRIRAALFELMNDLSDEPLAEPLDPATEQNLAKLTGLLLKLAQELTERLGRPPLEPQMDLDPAGHFDAMLAELENNPLLIPAVPADEAAQTELRNQLGQKLLDRLDEQFSAVTLIMAGIRLEMIGLVPVDLDPAEALNIARANRRDWQNARAALVDQWRQIELAANDLKSGLDVTFSGDINTLGDHPFRFRSTTGRLRVGLEFDAPLTRLAERNAYRETLIAYQRARRDYMAFEDAVSQSLRRTLRAVREAQLNFELQRAGVHVAISQVEVTRLRLREPPKVGAEQKFGATTVRDLLGALNGLLGAQNGILGVWVEYEVERLNLDLDLGTMQLDPDGVWIDPGPITAESLRARGDAEPLDSDALPPGVFPPGVLPPCELGPEMPQDEVPPEPPPGVPPQPPSDGPELIPAPPASRGD